MFVQKNSTAFTYVLATRHGDDCFDVVVEIDNAFVICRIDQNVAVAQDEWRIPGKIAGKIDNAAGSVLYCLRRVMNGHIVA